LPFKEIVSKIPVIISKIPKDEIIAKLPLLVQSFAFMARSQKVTGVNDPMIATLLGMRYIAGVCAPQFPYPIQCVVLASQAAFTAKNKGGDISLTLLVAVANQVLGDV